MADAAPILDDERVGPPVQFCKECNAETHHVLMDWRDDTLTCGRCVEKQIGGSLRVASNGEHPFDSSAHFRVNPGNGMCVLFLQSWADPDKNPANPVGAKYWRKMEKLYFDRPEEFRRLFCCSFRTASAPRIYRNFKRETHLRPDLKFNPLRPLLAQFDWGIQNPACVFSQWTDKGEYQVLLEILGVNCEAAHFFRWLGRLLKVEFSGAWGMPSTWGASPDDIAHLHESGRIVSIGDPFMGNARWHDGMTDTRFARSFGWHINYPPRKSPIRKIEKVRHLISPTENHGPRLFINGKGWIIKGGDLPRAMEEMEAGSLLSGFTSGYQWRTNSRGVVLDPMQPDKDIHSHLMDCISEGVEYTFDFEKDAPAPMPHPERTAADYYDSSTTTDDDLSLEYGRWLFQPSL
jgi:hypothetical protein